MGQIRLGTLPRTERWIQVLVIKTLKDEYLGHVLTDEQECEEK